LLQRARDRWELDAEVVATLALRGWGVAAGLLTTLVVPWWLTPQQQGYWYTFASLAALQLFFELGLGQVLLQLAGHEAAHAATDTAAAARLAALERWVRRWSGGAAAGFAVLVGPAGAWFLARSDGLPPALWLGPWCAMVLGTAGTLLLSGRLAVLEGSGRLAQVARLRLVQSMVGSVAAWALLALGTGLWAAAAVQAVGVACTLAWLRLQPPLVPPGTRHQPAQPLRWRGDILPFQWRIGLSWMSGWFIFQAFTPLAFATLGPGEAGRLGISMAVFLAVQSVGMSWVHARTPQFARHAARGERQALLALFRRASATGVGFVATASAATLLALWLLGSVWPSLTHRLADLPVLACLAANTVVNACIYAAATLMRAHREDPLAWVSAASAVATVGLAAITVRWGLLPMMASCLAVSAGLSLPWTLRLLRRYTSPSNP
jgi:hypothetical protein